MARAALTSAGSPRTCVSASTAAADGADDRARDGRGPGDAVEVERPARRRGQGQTGEEAQRVGDVADRACGAGGEGSAGQSAHRNMATARTPIAAKPDSIKPHCRTSAFAAATSWPRRDRIWLLSGAMTKNA